MGQEPMREGRRFAARVRVLLPGACRPRARSEVRCGWNEGSVIEDVWPLHPSELLAPISSLCVSAADLRSSAGSTSSIPLLSPHPQRTSDLLPEAPPQLPVARPEPQAQTSSTTLPSLHPQRTSDLRPPTSPEALGPQASGPKAGTSGPKAGAGTCFHGAGCCINSV